MKYPNELDERLTTRIQAKQFCKALKRDVLEAIGSIGNSFVEDKVNIQVDVLVFSAVRAIAVGTSCEVWASSDEVQMALLCLGHPELDFDGFYECVCQNCKEEIDAYKKEALPCSFRDVSEHLYQ